MGVVGLIYEEYNLVLCDFYDFMGVNSDIYVGYEENCSWVFYYGRNIVELYKYMNQDMVKIDRDVIYLKGYDA